MISLMGEFEFDASGSNLAIAVGAQAKAGTEGTSAAANARPVTGKQVKNSYQKGMAVFVHTKGGLMYEAAIGGQKFSFEAKGLRKNNFTFLMDKLSSSNLALRCIVSP